MNNEEILKSKIDERLQNNSWDFSIATAVMEKKHKRKKRVFSFALSLSAAAAVFLMIFTTVLKNSAEDNRYHNFITKQVEGTYSSTELDKYSSDSIDNFIDDTLAMR